MRLVIACFRAKKLFSYASYKNGDDCINTMWKWPDFKGFKDIIYSCQL